MINHIAFEEAFGPKRFLVWSKENEIWRTFYRTVIAGHWKKEDAEEFNACGHFYEVHLEHGHDDDAHLFCQLVMERCDRFKAAKVSKIAVNDMKVIVFLGKGTKMRDKIAHLASQSGFELARIRTKDQQPSPNEIELHQKFGEYLSSLSKAFAPMATSRAKHRG